MPKRILNITLIMICFILALSFLAFSAEEKITLTTFYPSPYGSYNELNANKMKIGETYSTNAVSVDPSNLIVEGNVGIGTASPITQLDVVGEIKIGNKGLLPDCSAQEAGKMRYNNNIKIMEYCNGSKWLSVGQVDVTTEKVSSKEGGGCDWVTTMYCSYNRVVVCPDKDNPYCTDPMITKDNWQKNKDLLCDRQEGGLLRSICKNALSCTFRTDYKWTAPPKIHYIDKYGVYDEDAGYTKNHTEAARCLCPEGQKRIACSGSRQRLGVDWGDEDANGYIATLPVTVTKGRVKREGCLSTADATSGCNEAIAVCYCAQ